MSDPKRLSDNHDLGADLLRSARRDRPSAKARARTVGALGLSAGTLTGTLTALIAPAGITTWKAVAMGLVVLGVTAGGVTMMASASSMPSSRPLDGAPLDPSHARDGIPPPAPEGAPSAAPSPMARFLSEQSSS